ncbi:hypothetical protein [Salinimicrobium sp. HB62]|uniref:hypothetical protein n=1 Tax=Salinimicrobium sp. HB62 TaxID=3077781 RepID=UPI002D773986|nr:hypothetical protein [Salinimicrobium sp. HB62]
MKIKYCRSLIRNNYGYGLTMIILGIFAVYINSSSIFSYLWIFLGILQAETSYYRQTYQYLTIQEDKLIRHSLIPKSIAVADIKRVKKYVNSYKIETNNQSMRIEKDFIDRESLKRLNLFLERLQPQISGTLG